MLPTRELLGDQQVREDVAPLDEEHALDANPAASVPGEVVDRRLLRILVRGGLWAQLDKPPVDELDAIVLGEDLGLDHREDVVDGETVDGGGERGHLR